LFAWKRTQSSVKIKSKFTCVLTSNDKHVPEYKKLFMKLNANVVGIFKISESEVLFSDSYKL